MPGVLRERLEKLAEKLGVHIADLRRGNRHAPDEVGPAGQIERGARQRLVHRQIGMRIALDAVLAAKRLRHRLAKRYAAILDGVVLVDMQVALCAERNVDARMAGKLLQHVIEKANAGGYGISALTVQVDVGGNFGLFGFAFDPRCSQVSVPICGIGAS